MIFGLANAEGASLISGGLGVLGSAISGNQQKKAAQEYNKGQMELAKYQYDKNLEMWNLQNAYNTPVAQMQRFRDAGLNPNLIYGQGSSGNASGMPEFQVPHQVQDNSRAQMVTDAMNAFSNAMSQYLSLKQQDEQNKLLSEQIRAQKLDNIAKETTNNYLDTYLGWRNDAMQYQQMFNYVTMQKAYALKQSEIDAEFEKYKYYQKYYPWLLGSQQREESREAQKLDAMLKMNAAQVKHLMTSDEINRGLFPYQRDRLKYDVSNSALDFIEHYDLWKHPWKNVGISNKWLSGFNLGVGANVLKGLWNWLF